MQLLVHVFCGFFILVSDFKFQKMILEWKIRVTSSETNSSRKDDNENNFDI
jgi:hypothetical protein